VSSRACAARRSSSSRATGRRFVAVSGTSALKRVVLETFPAGPCCSGLSKGSFSRLFRVCVCSARALPFATVGSLTSVVRDAQGEVIPDATIVLTNTATSERRDGVSAENGEHRFLNLVPGTYRLEVGLSGFRRYVRDRIEVNVQSQPRIEVALQLGSLAETIQVTGASPVLQTENASLGNRCRPEPVHPLRSYRRERLYSRLQRPRIHRLHFVPESRDTRDSFTRLFVMRSTRLRRKPCETPSGTCRPH